MKLYLSRVHFPITTLGPGKRIGIWFQGCSIRCEGCISADTWEFGEGFTTVDDLIGTITPWFADADGVTISGGEPFDQSEALFDVLKQVKLLFPGGDILVYSGYSLENIKKTVAEMSGLIDALITEPFQLHEKQTLTLRGSDNQILHTLTALGAERFRNAIELSSEGGSIGSIQRQKALDIMFDDDNTVWIAGIPQRGELEQLRELLQLKGIETVTSSDGGGKY